MATGRHPWSLEPAWQQFVQSDDLVGRQDDFGVHVPMIYLEHQLSTPSGWWQHFRLGHGDNHVNLRLSVLQHLCDGRVLRTETDPTRDVNANAAVYTALPGQGLFVIASIVAVSVSAGPTPTGLRCEWRVNPTDVPDPCPELYWEAASQSACQVRVARSQAALTEDRELVWDSGRVESALPITEYAGRAMMRKLDEQRGAPVRDAPMRVRHRAPKRLS